MAELLLNQKTVTNNKVLEILFDSDEVTWKSLIFSLIEAEQMDPWDIDVSIIANKFIAMLKQLKELDFRIGGKIVIASAILLKLKTNKLMDEEIVALDNLINSSDEDLEEAFFEDEYFDNPKQREREKHELVVRTPQPRKRKVSVYDLVEALEKVLDTKPRKIIKSKGTYKKVLAPENYTDISELMVEVYSKINNHFQATPKQKLTFTDIIISDHKEDKIMTFIPLLHLDNQRKIDITQQDHFGEIAIDLLEENADLTELAAIAETAQN